MTLAPKILRLLILEDSEDDAELVVHHLRRAGYEVHFQRVQTAAAMLKALETQTWDILISDYSMPQFTALDALTLLNEHKIDLPFIIVSGTVGEETAVAALQAGAHDFLLKGHNARLIPAIERGLRDAKERRRRREAEKQLQESELRFRLITENAQDLISLTNAEGQYVYVSPSFETMLGYPAEHLLTKRATDLIHVDDQSRLKDAGHYLAELRLQKANGTWLWVESVSYPITIDSAPLTVTIDRDITERKQAQEKLQRYNQRLNTLHAIDRAILTYQTPQEICQHALEFLVTHLSTWRVSIVFFDFETQEGMVFASYTQNGEKSSAKRRFVLKDFRKEEIETLRVDNLLSAQNVVGIAENVLGIQGIQDERLASYIAIPLSAEGNLIGSLNLGANQPNAFTEEYIQTTREIADQLAIAIQQTRFREQIERHTVDLERRVLERTAELQRTKDRVEAILNNSSDAIIFLSFRGTIQQVNLAFQDLFGHSITDIFEQSITFIAVPDNQKALVNALQTVITSGQPSRFDFVACRKDGSQFYADMALAVIRQDEQVKGLVCSVRDITERKQAEEELRQSLERERELNELKSRFVSMVSHEFRTPLTTILSSSQLLKNYHERLTDERRDGHLTKIETQVRRLTELLEDVLTLSRAESVGFRFTPIPLDLEELCRSLTEEIQVITNTPHQIVFSSDGDCAGFMGDEKLLRQIVINLLTNAIKYSPNGGDVEFRLYCDEDNATLIVKDFGLGIPPDDQKRLFEPFHRAKNVGTISGTGLGLAIVKRAVEAHKGTIAVDSVVDVGTTFTIIIPLYPRM
jgi:PAS domain S-box-containing protein